VTTAAAVRILGISTSSAALSCALFEGAQRVAHDHRRIGRGHAEAIIPALAALMAGRKADAIIVDVGPGSFTGIRIGIAAARALGLAWGAPVTGVTAASLVAAAAFAAAPQAPALTLLLDAGRGQLLHQIITPDFTATATTTLAAAALSPAAEDWLAGPGVALLPPGTPGHHLSAAEPDMAALLHLPPALRALPPQALYARLPDAQLPGAA
jgi:tRNA threonylcarbamoyl adenosine modification protein YeaZ